MSVMIREERPEDIAGVDRVNRDAIETSQEAQLVKRLHEATAMTLSLVAVIENRDEPSGIEHPTIVGHILFSPVLIQGEQENYRAIGLAPMAVLPKFQRQGIGSALVQAGLEQLRQRCCDSNMVNELPAAILGKQAQDKWNEPLAPSSIPNSERKFRLQTGVCTGGHRTWAPRLLSPIRISKSQHIWNSLGIRCSR